jgi:hypothetical protein
MTCNEFNAIKIEQALRAAGLTCEDPAGYNNGYRADAQGVHYKRYYRGNGGEFWVVEAVAPGSDQYIVEQLS